MMTDDLDGAFAQVRTTSQRRSTKSADDQMPALSFRFNV